MTDALAAAYRALARSAWDANLARATELAALLAAWHDAGRLTDEQRQRAKAVAHGLRGSAGTFGHERASAAAGELEGMLASAPAAGPPDAALSLMRQIHDALAQKPELDDEP